MFLRNSWEGHSLWDLLCNTPMNERTAAGSSSIGPFEQCTCIFQSANIQLDLILLLGGHCTPNASETLAHIDVALTGSAECKSLTLVPKPSPIADECVCAAVDFCTGQPLKEPVATGQRLKVGTKLNVEPGRASVSGPGTISTLKALTDTLIPRVVLAPRQPQEPPFGLGSDGGGQQGGGTFARMPFCFYWYRNEPAHSRAACRRPQRHPRNHSPA